MDRFRNILYVSEAAVEQASAVARAVTLAENNQAELTLVEVIPPATRDLAARGFEERMLALESLVAPYRRRVSTHLDILRGPVFLEVIRAVLRNGYDLVIKAADNPDFLERLFGSNDMHLLRKCPCPVWLMKPPEKSNYHCILAALDFDPLNPSPVEQALNQQILEMSASLALSDFASLHLVHAWEPMGEATLVSRSGQAVEDITAYIEKERSLHLNALNLLSERLRERIGAHGYQYLSPSFHLVKGPAQKTIAGMASDLQVDLVVMGTVARTGISGLFVGNTAEAILGQLKCSVLAIKPPEFTSPVKLDE